MKLKKPIEERKIPLWAWGEKKGFLLGGQRGVVKAVVVRRGEKQYKFRGGCKATVRKGNREK